MRNALKQSPPCAEHSFMAMLSCQSESSRVNSHRFASPEGSAQGCHSFSATDAWRTPLKQYESESLTLAVIVPTYPIVSWIFSVGSFSVCFLHACLSVLCPSCRGPNRIRAAHVSAARLNNCCCHYLASCSCPCSPAVTVLSAVPVLALPHTTSALLTVLSQTPSSGSALPNSRWVRFLTSSRRL